MVPWDSSVWRKLARPALVRGAREGGSRAREGGSRNREGGSRSLSSSEWRCGGQCRLQGTNPHRRQLSRSRRKKTFFQSVRRTIRVRGGRGQGSTSNLVIPNS